MDVGQSLAGRGPEHRLSHCGGTGPSNSLGNGETDRAQAGRGKAGRGLLDRQRALWDPRPLPRTALSHVSEAWGGTHPVCGGRLGWVRRYAGARCWRTHGVPWPALRNKTGLGPPLSLLPGPCPEPLKREAARRKPEGPFSAPCSLAPLLPGTAGGGVHPKAPPTSQVLCAPDFLLWTSCRAVCYSHSVEHSGGSAPRAHPLGTGDPC